MKIVHKFTSWVHHFTSRHLMLILIISLLFFAAVAVLIPRVFIVIPAGFQGVLYRPFNYGVDDKFVMREGINLIYPWNSATLYDGRIQVRKLDMEVLTADQLKSKVALTFQFEVNRLTLPLLHRYVGPKYIETLVIPEVTSITREVFGRLSSTNAFTMDINEIVKSIAQGADNVIINKLSPPGVDNVRLVRVSAVQIDSISYPTQMQEAIQDKLVQQQFAASYEYRIAAAKQEVDRKIIEAEGIKQFQNIVNQGLTENYLRYKGIEATEKLAGSHNSKIVIIGNSPGGLPLILGNDSNFNAPPSLPPVSNQTESPLKK